MKSLDEHQNAKNLELSRAVGKAIKICEGLTQDNRYKLIEVLATMYHDDMARTHIYTNENL